MKLVAVIPTLDPSEKIFSVVDEIISFGIEKLIIVDDGSKAELMWIFDKLKERAECTVIHHDVNRGKGRALKTAMQYFLSNMREYIGIVTLDDDGQHLVEDVVKCGRSLVENPSALVLGVRDFSGEDVPFKSRFGNRLTSMIFHIGCGIEISDTQTGLRAISAAVVKEFLKVEGERFEYETNVLLKAGRLGLQIVEVPISTVYIDGNAGTHFNPIRDSILIYRQVIKYMASSLASVFLDNILFVLFSIFLPIKSYQYRLLFSLVLSRGISSMVNFFTNKSLVFKHLGVGFLGNVSAIFKYYVVVLLQLAVSFVAINEFTALTSEYLELLWKLLVDGFLFVCTYNLQKYWVFKKR